MEMSNCLQMQYLHLCLNGYEYFSGQLSYFLFIFKIYVGENAFLME